MNLSHHMLFPRAVCFSTAFVAELMSRRSHNKVRHASSPRVVCVLWLSDQFLRSLANVCTEVVRAWARGPYRTFHETKESSQQSQSRVLLR